jgi:hypothetical protein
MHLSVSFRKRKRGGILPEFLSSALVNWLRAGGTLRRWHSTRFWRWMRTYLGHFTKRFSGFLGGRAPPMPEGDGRLACLSAPWSHTSSLRWAPNGDRECA